MSDESRLALEQCLPEPPMALLAAGTPIKMVRERLGRGKTSIALDTYAHVLADMQDRVVDAIDAVLYSASSSWVSEALSACG